MSQPKLSLTTRIFIGLIAGILFGVFVMPLGFMPEWSIEFVKFLGDIFLKLLKMIVVPLVLASIILAVAKTENLARLGKLGFKTVVFYTLTTAAASITGLLLVNIFKPGTGSNIVLEGGASVPEVKSIWEILLSLIPSNPVASMANMELPAVIFFALFFGALLSQTLPKGQVLLDIFEVINDIMIQMVHIILKVCPYGIFGLIAGVMHSTVMRAMEQSGEAAVWSALVEFFVPILAFYFTVLAGLLIHAVVTLPIILSLVGRENPLKYLRAMGPAMVMAFSTSSSAGTLPVTLDCAIEKGGVRKETAEFVIPIGATMNMDGTALYLGVSALFIGQVVGLDLSISQQILVFLTAMIASVGAAGIPSGSLVLMVIIFNAVGLPMSGVGLLLAVDRFLDMARTMTNVWGDAIGAKVVDVLEGAETPEPVSE
jgi:Na+/H+-dicarboxylate symporter